MKLNNEVHEMKNKYYILDSHYKNANTPEFGFGDFPQKTRYVKCIVFAETKRKAQNIFKKHYGKDKTFGGYFGYQIKDKKLEIEPTEMKWVKFVYGNYIEGKSKDWIRNQSLGIILKKKRLH